MKKIMLILVMVAIAISPVYAALGTIHLIYTNGQIVEDTLNTYYEFDVQAYISEGNEVLGAGMAYVEYPVSIFGNLAITNDIVTVTKAGILAGTFPEVTIYLYDIIENDTYSDVFAVTFESPFTGDGTLKQYYSEISNDPLAPSDLLHIRMDVTNYGAGNILFPAYIPGLNNLYFNFENETFSGGLNISEANEPVVYEDPTPDPVGTVDFKSLVANWKKDVIEVKWATKDEVDIEGYVVKRSVNGGESIEVASYLTDPTLIAQSVVNVMRYAYEDLNVIASNSYSYMIEAIDIVGCALPYGPVDVISDAIVEASYPNPFNPSFVVPFELFSTQDVDIKLYDMGGRIVRNIVSGTYSVGRYEYRVNCNDLSSGVYILRTVINNNPSSQKMLLVK
ncbi:MAG: T9SS type A sorting domain-containing protein [Candidatus Marinimicrobia bacterium]|nr:T9SS type A sorting domain-containing protein [Candidatus Neomarinimicrobiota bacterium]